MIFPSSFCNTNSLYSVDLKVWRKLAKRALIKRIASKCARIFDCNWQHVNVFSFVLLWYVFYFCKLSLTLIQKYRFLLWNVSGQVLFMHTIWYFYFILNFKVSRIYKKHIGIFVRKLIPLHDYVYCTLLQRLPCCKYSWILEKIRVGSTSSLQPCFNNCFSLLCFQA